MNKVEQAKRLSEETGFTIKWAKSCFTLFDGKDLWFPLYTTQDVIRKSHYVQQYLGRKKIQ